MTTPNTIMKTEEEIIKDIRLLLSLPFIIMGAIFLHIAELISEEVIAFHCKEWDDVNDNYENKRNNFI